MAAMIDQFPNFTPEARQLWENVPAHIRPKLLSNVYCGECRGATTIVNYSGSVKQGLLVLEGSCLQCGSDVARVID